MRIDRVIVKMRKVRSVFRSDSSRRLAFGRNLVFYVSNRGLLGFIVNHCVMGHKLVPPNGRDADVR